VFVHPPALAGQQALQFPTSRLKRAAVPVELRQVHLAVAVKPRLNAEVQIRANGWRIVRTLQRVL
jgi:hypothetical protein